MAIVLATPGQERFDPKNHLEEDMKAFLEAFALLETGMLPADLLKKIA